MTATSGDTKPPSHFSHISDFKSISPISHASLNLWHADLNLSEAMLVRPVRKYQVYST